MPALLVAVAGPLGLWVPGARADTAPGTVALSASAYTAHEAQGYLTITILRTDADGTEYVRYGVKQQDAESGLDFDAVPNSVATFLPGQASFSFEVHIYDLGMNAPPVHALAYLYGSSPQTLGDPNNAIITILRDDPLQAREDANPLGAPTVSATGDPLQGAKLYVPGANSGAGQAEAEYQHSDPSWARALAVVAAAPTGYRFWYWNTPADPAGVVAHFLEHAEQQQPGSTVQLTTYSVVHGACGENVSPAFVRSYQAWVRGLAQGIGNFHVLMFFEIDSLITSSCLSEHAKRVRFEDELAYGIHTLEQDPHVVVYVDAGAADALTWRTAAADLVQAGVHDAQGFFLNATHFDWTTTELAYGQRIAKALGGVHFVINTGENGRGPLQPADILTEGLEVLCNPPGRGLGPWSTTTGYRWADAFIWTATPESQGEPATPGRHRPRHTGRHTRSCSSTTPTIRSPARRRSSSAKASSCLSSRRPHPKAQVLGKLAASFATSSETAGQKLTKSGSPPPPVGTSRAKRGTRTGTCERQGLGDVGPPLPPRSITLVMCLCPVTRQVFARAASLR